MKKQPKTKVELQLYNWNKGTKAQQDKILFHLLTLINDLQENYRKVGISDDFTASY